MNNKSIFAVAAAVFLGVLAYYIDMPKTPPSDSGQKACTMEAKLCPDGSSVSRSGPNCEFATCPVKPAPTPTNVGGIKGTVMLGPTCPVMREPPDPGCADKPYAAHFTLVQSENNSVVKEFDSNTDGKFSIVVPPGTYSIHPTSTSMLPRCSSVGNITVVSGTYITTDIVCDSGIR